MCVSLVLNPGFLIDTDAVPMLLLVTLSRIIYQSLVLEFWPSIPNIVPDTSKLKQLNNNLFFIVITSGKKIID